jgi:Leucine-rich repeat (LRR) protein
MDSTGLVEFPDLTPSILKALFLNGNQMDDTMGAKLLDSIIATPTIRLSTLRLNSNRLTRIPTQQITSFPELQNLYLDDNVIPVLETGSLTFLFPVSILSLSSASINTIEPNAFQGIMQPPML